MKALLVVIILQSTSSGESTLQSPVVMYYSSMDICEQQKSIVVQAIKDSVSGPLSTLPQNLNITISARCSSADDW
ncbi:hypothetical protein ABFT80_24610 [Mesorhizobium sp. SB112]|uniref:hypothetical protein n=1 Tax=Mesorhizobium sp. SB112 TaxID=3151853 RepID=UPI003262F5DD